MSNKLQGEQKVLLQTVLDFLLSFLITYLLYLLTYLLTYLFHGAEPFLRSQPVKFPGFYEKRSFITAFTTARHLSLSCARSIQSMPPPQSHFPGFLEHLISKCVKLLVIFIYLFI